MHFSIHHWIQHYGFWGVFAMLALEMLGFPIPAETTLTILGLQWDKGGISFIPFFLAAVSGNIVGSSAAYGIGLKLGRNVILRYGKWVKLTPDRLERAERSFQKHGYSLVAVAKFIAGVRVLVPYLSGINRIPFLRFSLVNAISALVWSSVFMLLGRYLGVVWFRYLKHFHLFVIAIVGIVIALVVVIALRKRKKSLQE